MRYFIAVMAVLLISAAWAIDPPRPQAPPPSTPTAQGQAEPAPVPAAERPDIEQAEKAAAAEAEPEVEETLPPLPADLVPAGPPPARFNPTEKVRADFPVSFPIDI